MFAIDTLSDIPIYTQIRNGIIKEIANGNLKNGDPLPSIRQFARDFDVNPMTVNKSYAILKQEGFIEIDRRSGAFISVKNDEASMENINTELENIINEVKARGFSKEVLLEMIERGF